MISIFCSYSDNINNSAFELWLARMNGMLCSLHGKFVQFIRKIFYSSQNNNFIREEQFIFSIIVVFFCVYCSNYKNISSNTSFVLMSKTTATTRQTHTSSEWHYHLVDFKFIHYTGSVNVVLVTCNDKTYVYWSAFCSVHWYSHEDYELSRRQLMINLKIKINYLLQ